MEIRFFTSLTFLKRSDKRIEKRKVRLVKCFVLVFFVSGKTEGRGR
jgi:hypothetical protein